jgi:hypothetical protein
MRRARLIVQDLCAAVSTTTATHTGIRNDPVERETPSEKIFSLFHGFNFIVPMKNW